jgi:hypothetical protein
MNLNFQLFKGVWYNIKKYENKYQKSYDCGMTSFQWNGNSVNRTLCEKKRYSYLCFNGEVKFINPETQDGQLFYQDNKFSKFIFLKKKINFRVKLKFFYLFF